VSHPVLRPKPDAHYMSSQDQVSTRTARITAIQIKQVSQSEYIITRVYCLITSRLNKNSHNNAQHNTGSQEEGTPARRTLHQGTPHLRHLMNNNGGMARKASVSTLMVGTLQVLGTYDMNGYKPRNRHDAVKHKASYA
jgi:hypothetical protein